MTNIYNNAKIVCRKINQNEKIKKKKTLSPAGGLADLIWKGELRVCKGMERKSVRLAGGGFGGG